MDRGRAAPDDPEGGPGIRGEDASLAVHLEALFRTSSSRRSSDGGTRCASWSSAEPCGRSFTATDRSWLSIWCRRRKAPISPTGVRQADTTRPTGFPFSDASCLARCRRRAPEPTPRPARDLPGPPKPPCGRWRQVALSNWGGPAPWVGASPSPTTTTFGRCSTSSAPSPRPEIGTR